MAFGSLYDTITDPRTSLHPSSILIFSDIQISPCSKLADLLALVLRISSGKPHGYKTGYWRCMRMVVQGWLLLGDESYSISAFHALTNHELSRS